MALAKTTTDRASNPRLLKDMTIKVNSENPLRSPNKEFLELSCVCTTGTSIGTNKYYRMENNGDGTFTATWGRIGVTTGFGAPRSFIWSMDMWETKYYEKAHEHGYLLVKRAKADDIAIQTVKVSGKLFAPIPDKGIAAVVQKIMSYARIAVQQNYTVKAGNVTAKQIKMAEKLIGELDAITDVSDFNDKLTTLFSAIPRKMDYLQQFLAKTSNDFEDILNREQSLIDTLRNQVQQVKTDAKADSNKTILDAMGLSWRAVTPEEEKNIIKYMGASSNRYVRAYRVVNEKADKKFNDFVKKNHIRHGGIKFLYHGTKNQNVWGIIGESLLLNPNVPITGKMFGRGIYFAPLAQKSLGYCSQRGSYWAKGTDSTGFLTIFKVATGKTYDVSDHKSLYSSLDYNGLQQLSKGANSLYAHAGQVLRNDEIIIYKEEQCTMRYIVEIK